ncbi:hypothetical protein QSE00_16895 [Arenibacter sp. M-2]|uniref:hypothetical protein n=1 Tax=Arenibacter sp. M-2 TaxID=3053612 RepID=UPI00257110D7|nr:hypothetical protein [Arenibacter sp. M-2]MDL5513506.1 hypothetical protein [Arenibacter sp. M-2]
MKSKNYRRKEISPIEQGRTLDVGWLISDSGVAKPINNHRKEIRHLHTGKGNTYGGRGATLSIFNIVACYDIKP